MEISAHRSVMFITIEAHQMWFKQTDCHYSDLQDTKLKGTYN